MMTHIKASRHLFIQLLRNHAFAIHLINIYWVLINVKLFGSWQNRDITRTDAIMEKLAIQDRRRTGKLVVKCNMTCCHNSSTKRKSQEWFTPKRSRGRMKEEIDTLVLQGYMGVPLTERARERTLRTLIPGHQGATEGQRLWQPGAQNDGGGEKKGWKQCGVPRHEGFIVYTLFLCMRDTEREATRPVLLQD